MRLRPFAPLGLLALTGYLACTPAPALEQPASAAPRLTNTHRTAQNGLTSNGLFQNGLFQNGLFQNGLFQNGLFQNGLFQNSLALEALWQRQTWEANPAALAVLRDNVYARDALKYVYECAKTPTQSKIIAFEGVTLELHGLIGLAPEPAQPGDECDEMCQQRWVTACVLARTNAYGLPVDISMRAPDDAPATVKAALSVTDDERTAYPLREGAFYGNLFRQAPREGDGPIVMAPKFYGCAGPGSNIPQVTKRFCSSQGAGGPIAVPGTCEPRTEFPKGACQGVSGDATTGAMHDCYERVDPNARGEHYPEVITVYLKQPIEVCGNSVCEENEEIATNGPETTRAGGAKGRPNAVFAAGDAFAAGVACPSDCHPGGWASSLAASLGESVGPGEVQSQISTPYWVRTAALGPGDSIVVAGIAPTTVDLGGGPLTAGPDGKQYGAVAKYGPQGEHVWSKRFGFGFKGTVTPIAVAVAPDGSIGVLLVENEEETTSRLWLGKFTPAGNLEWNRAFEESETSARYWADTLAFDDGGSLIVSGNNAGRVTFGEFVVGNPSQPPRQYVLKVSPDGVPQWAVGFTHGESFGAKTLAADHDGNVLLSLEFNARGILWKLDATSGATLWQRGGFYGGVAVGPNNHVYATGMLGKFLSFEDTYPFDIPLGSSVGDFFLVEYAADGAYVGSRVVSPNCDDHGCGNSEFEGRHLAVDVNGNVVVGGLGGGSSMIDFGAGPFPTYATDDVFVTAFSPELEPLWAKHVPMVLSGDLQSLHLDSQGRVVLSGTFAGSMLVDDRLLVSTIPEQAGVINTYLATFGVPELSDDKPPVVTNAHVPQPMTLEATSATGAEVFFLPPTAIDAGHAGVNVTCSHAPNRVFPIGTTTVTCAAIDPLGNKSTTALDPAGVLRSVEFTVTVVDQLGPAFLNVPAPITVTPPSGSASAVVTFPLPLALDQIDGSRPVTCTPASGSVFSVGTREVTCSAADAQGHLTEVSFDVTVADVVPPSITHVPAPFTIEASEVGGARPTFELPLAFDLVDENVPITCSPASGAVFPLGPTTVTCSASDAQGNLALATFVVTVVDTTPPTLSAPEPIAAIATSSQGAVVTYAASATDVASGPLTPTCSLPSGSLLPPGTTTVTCSATDPSGNTTTSSSPVTVTFAWSGLLKPLDSDGQAFRVGTKLKVRFRLTEASAGILDLPATLSTIEATPKPLGALAKASSPGAATGAMPFRYDPSKGWYEYELATKSMAPGEWDLRLQFGDGVPRSVQIRLWR